MRGKGLGKIICTESISQRLSLFYQNLNCNIVLELIVYNPPQVIKRPRDVGKQTHWFIGLETELKDLLRIIKWKYNIPWFKKWNSKQKIPCHSSVAVKMMNNKTIMVFFIMNIDFQTDSAIVSSKVAYLSYLFSLLNATCQSLKWKETNTFREQNISGSRVCRMKHGKV